MIFNGCSCVEAQFAVIGEYDNGFGIISWHINEVDAHRTKKAINLSSRGYVWVRKTPNGEIEHIKDEVHNLVFSHI
jgi:hypothetical protein